MATREITDHRDGAMNDSLKITALGEPGPGGANTHYVVQACITNPDVQPPVWVQVGRLIFQNGDPANEINGITNEALLAVVLDRLRGFQAGPFANGENAIALTYVEAALAALKARTHARLARGVAGKQVA